MLPADPITHGAHVLTVCNACRYCEQYCPVFPAMEQRETFARVDLSYLANLCHNCGECLYACQYAPPHEFGINVPRTLAEIRLASYEDYSWPRPFASLVRRHSPPTAVALTALFSTLFAAAAAVVCSAELGRRSERVMKYEVIAMPMTATPTTLVISRRRRSPS